MAELQLKELRQTLAEDTPACIAQAERDYAAQIAALSGGIIARGTRVVLLAGPSSSGKTTTANMLADSLRRAGHEATVVSLDDFYRLKDDPAYPKNEKGEPDFEAPGALRIDMIREVISAVMRGGEVKLPRFDFKLARRFDNAVTVKIPVGGCAVIEGLHALNPLLTEGMDPSDVTRVFVSVSTNISDGDRRILSGRKIRFIRRLTRDFLYRASDAKRTLSYWEGVRRGEDLYLYPFKETADFKFDTFHTYELGVMKPLAERVMDEDPDFHAPYLDVIRAALSRFDAIPLDLVPDTSLLREFVPGGIYEDLY